MSSETSSVTITDIARFLESWAPPTTAESYDNVGLQVGDPTRTVRHVLVALDLTPGVVDEAKSRGIDLVITHHPLIFRPLKNLTPGSWSGGLALRLAEEGIALYSIHTNLDAAADGVSFALARALQLTDIRILRPARDLLYKLVTFVPRTHLEPVRSAMAAAGDGTIGAYTDCAYASEGTGYFRPGAGTHPFIGISGGDLETADEIRLEVEVDRWNLDRILGALRGAHPYEKVAYDVYPVQQPHTRIGMGAIGTLSEPLLLNDFLSLVRSSLSASVLRYAGDLEAHVQRVAVCGGAGSDLIADAMRMKADAYVTADLTYHRFFDVLDGCGRPRLALIDAGHYETEREIETVLVETLAGRFPEITWDRTATKTSPVHIFI